MRGPSLSSVPRSALGEIPAGRIGGVATPNRSGFPIIEVPLRDHTRIAAVGEFLYRRGVYVTLAAFPLVPKNEVGFRFQVTAANTDAEVDMAIAGLEALAELGELKLVTDNVVSVVQAA